MCCFNAFNSNVTEHVERVNPLRILLLGGVPPHVGNDGRKTPNVNAEQDVLSVDRQDKLC